MTIYSLDGIAPEFPETGDYWVADSAELIGAITLENEVSVWFGAVLRGDNERITVGAGSNIQENSVLHTDMGFPLTIGRDVTVGHKALLHGCTIGDGCLIGMNATVMNGAVIGQNCLIGAGAMVTEGKVIPDNSMVLGMPGKVIKTLGEQDRALLALSAQSYRDNYKRFVKGLKPVT